MASSPFTLLAALILCFSVAHCAPKTPSKIGKGYRLISVEEAPGGGIVGHLAVKSPNTFYGPDIPHLRLFVKHETEDRLRVQITDASRRRWEVPYTLIPRESPPSLSTEYSVSSSRKTTEYSSGGLTVVFKPDPFGFAVKRKSDNQVLFNTSSESADPFGELVFKDQYLEISTRIPSTASLYGLGENTQAKGIKIRAGEPYTLYTTDISAINLNADLYGSHPVYMDLRGSGGSAYAHAVLLMNSNGMDVFYRGDSLTYKVIGGVLDFYFFAGPTPLDVVDQYTAFVGRPAAMPYWSLGFHQCRWGYHNLSVVEDVVANYQKARIPLDVIWNDDDHMDGHKDFTLNQKAYPHEKLIAFLDRIHKIGMKYIVIIDPGIGVNSSYGTYNRGMANDVFIKYEGEPYLAQVWPGPVHFPDFLNPRTVKWWGDEVRRFHELVPVDGLWIDMNEASNFCSGKCKIPKGVQCPSGTGPGWICCLECKNITNTKWDDPPYKINASGISAPIGFKTIATSATHYNNVLEYDAHSLYGFSQSIATHEALLGLEGKRPFILSRSTFVGSGKYAAHWTGDNKGTWEDLRYSISTILNFGIFGVPMVGSDICGFYPAPTEELCNRWIEVGAFYPFSRDHANFYSPRQELYQWDSVAKSARNALGMRYRLLPYLYTLTYEAHKTGSPIARPLFFTFPEYEPCRDVSTQFLLGKGLMISPVLDKDQTSVSALFPPGTWYNLFDMSKAIFSEKGKHVALDAPLHVINAHVYQGMVIPMQRGGLISKEARNTPFSLVVTFPAGSPEGTAEGLLYLDDDESPEMNVGKEGTLVKFYATVSKGVVKVWSEVAEGKFAVDRKWVLEKVSVLGLSAIGEASSEIGEVSSEKIEIEVEVSGEGIEVEVEGAGVEVEVEVSREGIEVEVEGPPASFNNAQVSSSEHVHVDGNGDDSEEQGSVKRGKSMMVEVKGLSLLIGKNFALSWKMASLY